MPTDRINNGIRWGDEPHLEELRRLYALALKEPTQAIAGLESLAQRGSVASMWYLADIYRRKDIAARSVEKAVYWFERLQEKRIVQASHMLGRITSESGDYERALHEFSAGAERGYPPSMYRLGLMYKEGKGTDADMELCRRWLSAAASKGHFFAKRDLMTLYLAGRFGRSAVGKGIAMLFSLARDLILLKSERDDESLKERIIC